MNRSFYEYFLSRIAQDGILLESFCNLIVESVNAHGLNRPERDVIGSMGEEFVRKKLKDIYPGYDVEKSTEHQDKNEGTDAILISPDNNRMPIQIKQKASQNNNLEIEIMVNYNPDWPDDVSIKDKIKGIDKESFVKYKGVDKHKFQGQAFLSKAQKYFMTNLYQNKIYEINNSAINSIIDNVITGLMRGDLPKESKTGVIKRNGCNLKVQNWNESERRKSPVGILGDKYAYRITIEIPWSLIPSSDKKIYNVQPPNFADSVAKKLGHPDPALVVQAAPIGRPETAPRKVRMPAYFEQEFIQAMGGKKTATFTPETNDEKNWLRDLVNKNGYKLEEKGKDFIVKK